MSNVKNYTEQGGEKWVVGGTLEIKEGASVTGLPSSEISLATEDKLGGLKASAKGADDTVEAKIGENGKLYVPAYPTIPELPLAENQAASTADTLEELIGNFNALLCNLKDAGYMVLDSWNISVGKISTPTGDDLISNQSKVTDISINDNLITVTVNVDELIAFPSSNPVQGTHKWIGMNITTGLSDITKIKYNGYQLTIDDVIEAKAFGGSDGDILMWLKCDEIVNAPKTFTLWASGYQEATFAVVISVPGEV